MIRCRSAKCCCNLLASNLRAIWAILPTARRREHRLRQCPKAIEHNRRALKMRHRRRALVYDLNKTVTVRLAHFPSEVTVRSFGIFTHEVFAYWIPFQFQTGAQCNHPQVTDAGRAMANCDLANWAFP